jgi:hypothetical protein
VSGNLQHDSALYRIGKNALDAERNSSAPELFSTEGAATVDAYVEVLKSWVLQIWIVYHGEFPFCGYVQICKRGKPLFQKR